MAQILLQNWLLRDLTPEEAELLSKSIQKIAVDKNKSIIVRATKNDALWIVASGEVGILKPMSTAGAPEILAKLGSGDLFGEMSWLDGQPASTDVVTLSQAHLLKIKYQDFDEFLWKNPDAHIGILRKFAINLCHRLRGK